MEGVVLQDVMMATPAASLLHLNPSSASSVPVIPSFMPSHATPDGRNMGIGSLRAGKTPGDDDFIRTFAASSPRISPRGTGRPQVRAEEDPLRPVSETRGASILALSIWRGDVSDRYAHRGAKERGEFSLVGMGEGLRLAD